VAAGIAALVLSGCGSGAGSADSAAQHPSRGRVDDPRTRAPNHLQCLRDHHLPVRTLGATGMQIGQPPAGPMIVFEPTATIAEGDQIQAREQGAEAIGNALLYPNQAPDAELKTVEDCLSAGVTG